MNRSKLLLLYCRDSWDLNPWLLGFGLNRLIYIVTSLTGQKSLKQPLDLLWVDFFACKISEHLAGGLDGEVAVWCWYSW